MDLSDVKVVNKKLADGTIKKYYYRRSTMTRIEGDPASAIFRLNWARAGAEAKEGHTPGEFAQLIVRYKSSPEISNLSKKYKHDMFVQLDRISEEFGHLTLSQIQSDGLVQEIYDWRDSRASTPVAADRGVGFLNLVLTWAKKRRIIRINQADDIDLLINRHERLKRSRARITWNKEWTTAFLNRAQPWLSNAFWLSYFTAAREADVCRMRWDQIKDGWLVFTPSKTRYSTAAEVHLPIFALPPFEKFLTTIPKMSHGYILSTKRGNRLSGERIRDGMNYAVQALGDWNIHWHDIRGTIATELADAGCSNIEISSITGHRITESSEETSLVRYVSTNRQHAINAYTKLSQFWERNQSGN